MNTVFEKEKFLRRSADRRGAVRHKLGEWSYRLRKAAWVCEDLILDRLTPAGDGLPYKLMVTSVPKSGTHLLIEALKNLNEFKRRPLALEPYHLPSSYRASLERMTGNRFAWAHLGASDEMVRMVSELGIRLIVVLRDPRDVVVSFVDHVYRIRVHALNSYYDSLPDDESRLIAAIRGAPRAAYDRDPKLAVAGVYDQYTGYADIGTVYRNFLRWEEIPGTLSIRFEDLIGKRGGGSCELQFDTLKRIISFLGLDYPDCRISEIGSRVFSIKASTFNQGVRCRWRSVFSEPVKQAFKAVGSAELIAMGCEQDENW